MVNRMTKAPDHSIGASNVSEPRNMVLTQLNTFTPVGIEMIIVVMPKKALTLAPEPMVKKWCSQTMNDRMPIASVAPTIDL
ncbi:hypothetical protein G6F32_016149 [Rhizopus arrhizus]|nr:hypothetical protein G6F32_016149 [Rhizopus arrhizus]